MNDQEKKLKTERMAEKIKKMFASCGCGCCGCDPGVPADDAQKDPDAE